MCDGASTFAMCLSNTSTSGDTGELKLSRGAILYYKLYHKELVVPYNEHLFHCIFVIFQVHLCVWILSLGRCFQNSNMVH